MRSDFEETAGIAHIAIECRLKINKHKADFTYMAAKVLQVSPWANFMERNNAHHNQPRLHKKVKFQ